MRKSKIKKIIIVLLVVTFSLVMSACIDNGISSGTEDASLSGRLVFEKDDEVENQGGLIVLKKDSKEVARKYNEYDKEKFNFANLNSKEEYTLNVYKLGDDKYSKTVVLNEGQNDLGKITLELERAGQDEKNGVFILEINTEYSPMEKDDVRKALAYAINKKELSDTAENLLDNPEKGNRYTTQKANRIITPAQFGNDGNKYLNLEQDISKANSLLNKDYTITINYVGGEFYNELTNKIKKINEINNLNVKFNVEDFNSEEYNKAPVSLKVWSSNLRSPLFSYKEIIDLDKNDKDLLNKIKMNLDSSKRALEYLNEFEENLIKEGKIIPVYYRASYEE